MKLVVIGGTAAGLSAASRVRKFLPDADITVVERTGYVSYGSCGLPYFVSGLIGEPGDLVSFTPEQLAEKRDMKVLMHHEALSVDPAAKTVEVKNLDTGAFSTLDYDAMVIATGARAAVPAALRKEADNLFTLRSVEDGIAIRQRAGDMGRVSVIGGGFIGLEMCEAFVSRGIRTTLYEAQDRLLPGMPQVFSEAVLKELLKNGVEVHLSTQVDELLVSGGRVTAVRAGETLRETDAVLVCIGVRPNSELAAAAGAATEPNGAISVDRHQRTTVPGIWACGDCASTFNRVSGERCYAPLGTNANKQGRVAGADICGKDVSFPGVLPSQVTKVFDLYCASTGLSEQQAENAGIPAGSSLITKRDRASYYPGGSDNELCVVFHRETGRVLGAQGIGGSSVAGRINALAVAVTAEMTVQELSELDLVYAPPVAPVYDPILIAGENAVKAWRKQRG